jgi:hypothetical protein
MAEATDAARKDIEYIKSLIDESRTVLIENGSSFIIWGALIPLGTLASYIIPTLTTSFVPILAVWALIYVLGFGIFLIKNRGRKGKKTGSSYAGRIYGSVWIGAAATMLVAIGAGGAARSLDLNACMAVVCCLLGGAYFVSGTITRYRWLTALAFPWWTGGAVIFFLPAYWGPAMTAGLVVLLEFLPGLIALTRAKRIGRAA